jgi:hypothetical protein
MLLTILYWVILILAIVSLFVPLFHGLASIGVFIVLFVIIGLKIFRTAV